MLRRALPLLASLLLAVAPLSCCCEDDDDCCDGNDDQYALVGLTIEVLDVGTADPIAAARVTLVQVEHEWSGCICQSPFEVHAHTGTEGLVRFDAENFGDAEIGFLEDHHGRAVLPSDGNGDEAIVTLRIAAAGYGTVTIDVPLSFSVPDGLVTVPLTPLP